MINTVGAGSDVMSHEGETIIIIIIIQDICMIAV
jgi:hypothetical protein